MNEIAWLRMTYDRTLGSSGSAWSVCHLAGPKQPNPKPAKNAQNCTCSRTVPIETGPRT